MAIRKPTAPADKSAAMAEMLASAGQEIKFKNGKLVEGTVCGIKDDDVCVDIGYKSVGVIGIDEFATIEGEAPAVKVGDKVTVGQPLATLERSSDPESLTPAAAELYKAFVIGPTAPEPQPLIIEKVA